MITIKMDRPSNRIFDLLLQKKNMSVRSLSTTRVNWLGAS